MDIPELMRLGRTSPLFLLNSLPWYVPICGGFGQSSKPADQPNHAGSSKRAKAKDCLELMQSLGYERFALAGHDRGSYTAYRAALDYPENITHLAVLDGVPIIEALVRCNARFAHD